MVKEQKIAEKMAKKNNFKPKEVELLLSQLYEVVIDMLLNGNTVQLGGLGSFRLTVKSEASKSEEEVTAAKIKKATVRFTESNELKIQ